MHSKELVTIRGILKYRVYKDGKEIFCDKGDNLVVTTGRDALVKLLSASGSEANKSLTTIGCGTNGTTPAMADTALTGAFTKPLDASTYPSSGVLQLNFTIATTEANGMAIAEFGLICGDASLFSRKTVPVINKTSSIQIIGQWQIIF